MEAINLWDLSSKFLTAVTTQIVTLLSVMWRHVVFDTQQYFIETTKMETPGSCETLLYIHQTMQLQAFMYT